MSKKNLILFWCINLFSFSVNSQESDKWPELRVLDSEAANKLKNISETLCGLEKKKAIEKNTTKEEASLLPNYKLISLDSDSFGNHYFVFDSLKDMERISFKGGEKSFYYTLEYYNANLSKKMKNISLLLTLDNCHLVQFDYLQQGRISTNSSYPQVNKYLRNYPKDLLSSKLNKKPVIVAVIESAFALDNPRLMPFLLRDKNGKIVGLDSKSFTLFPTDDPNVHANHVAGIVSNQSPDIAILPIARPDDNLFGEGPARLRPLPENELIQKVIEQVSHQEIELIDFAIKNGAKIVNMSFGSTSNKNQQALANSLSGFEKSFDKHEEVLFVVSAGNAHLNINDSYFKEGPSHPTSLARDNVAVVGAVDSNGHLASFSNFGDRIVDFAAPGVDIESLGIASGTYVNDVLVSENWPNLKLSGTSMAAPYVSRVAAKMLKINPELTPKQLIRFLCDNVIKDPSLSETTRCGGYVDENYILEKLKTKKD